MDREPGRQPEAADEPALGLPRWSPALRLAVVALVLALGAGAFGVSFALSHHHRRSDRATTTTDAPVRTPACPPPATHPTTAATRTGGWRLSMLASGVFEDLSSATGAALVALQACGTTENALRVVSIDPHSGRQVDSLSFNRAAPLASDLVATSSGVFFGDSRLALGGSSTAPPYRLTLVRLDPATLAVSSTTDLGRGYGLEVVAGPDGSVIASTGRQIYDLSASGALRLVASFPGVVIQHLALVPASDAVVASLFTPSAVPPAASTRIALVDLSTGATTASVAISAGDEIESLTVAGRVLTVSVGTAGASEIERYSIGASLAKLPRARHGVPATLTPLTVTSSGRAVWVLGEALAACIDPASGAVLASATPAHPTAALSEVLATGAGVYAVDPSGLAVLDAPAACSRG